MVRTYKNDNMTFTLKVGECYRIEDEFTIANYKIKQLGKNVIKVKIVDSEVYKIKGNLDIEVYMVEDVKVVGGS